MRVTRFLPVLALLLASCAMPTPVGPVDPVRPVPVDPVKPVPPPPVPADRVVPYATAHAVTDGASRESVEASIGFAPMLSTRQDDGTTIARWATVGSAGAPKWLDVVYGTTGLVIGKALIPRAVAP